MVTQVLESGHLRMYLDKYTYICKYHRWGEEPGSILGITMFLFYIEVLLAQ